MKEVQCKIREDVAHLVELKAETKAAIKHIQEERHHIETLNKELKNQLPQIENAASDSATQTSKCQEVVHRKGCEEIHLTGRLTKRR